MGGRSYSNLWHRHEESLLEDEEELKRSALPMIRQPQTPKEPMEFLSRSWSLSTTEVAKALANHKPKNRLLDKSHNVFPERTVSTLLPPKVLPTKATCGIKQAGSSSIGKWLPAKESSSSNIVKKKDKLRVDNACMQRAVSVAGLAAALAAIAHVEQTSSSRMSQAIASATELLASHCIELAESTGANHDRVTFAVRSAVDIRSPGDLMTLTASAATALRGEATLKARFPKESVGNASVSPYKKIVVAEEEHFHPCTGDLLQQSRTGRLQRKYVSVYINKKSEVVIKLKTKHVGGAFSKKNQSIVYEVCDENSAALETGTDSEEIYFGVRTAKGFVEFKCKSKNQKEKWVIAIRNLLCQANNSISSFSTY